MTAISEVQFNGTLVDGVKRNAEHPDTFLIPDACQRENVKIGDFVKVCVEFEGGESSGERFWVRVVSRSGADFIGEVRNDLIFTECHELEFGNHFRFQAEHILTIDDEA